MCQAGPSSAGSAPVPPASPGRAAQTFVFGLPLSHLHSFRGLGISPRYKREAVCRECGYTPYACCLCSSSPKKRSDPKEIPAKSRFFPKTAQKKRGRSSASSQKQNRGLSCTLRFVILLLNLNGPVNRALNDRQKFLRAEFQFVADPLPLCAFLPHDLRVKIPFHGKPADFNKLYDNRQAGNRAVIFDVGKIAPVDVDLFRQRLTR